VDFYVQRGSVPQLEVCPYAHPTLIAGLGVRGFVVREFEHVMARALLDGEDLDALMVPAVVSGLTLEHVDPTDTAAVETHIEVATSGFRTGSLDEASRDLNLRMLRHPRFDALTARIDDTVAGGASVETFGELACLLGTTVLPAWRRRGVQSALMVARMKLARDRGAKWMCVHSEPGIATERNALRMGFAVIYTKVVMHRPTPGLTPSR
jgi:GNAT superfamily N-acetyltransferase